MDLAYAVGLIATDGNLSKDGRHIDLTSKDREQVETFRECLCLKVMIGAKTSGRGHKDAFRIQFGSVLFYQWLLSIGLTSKKSRTLGKLNIPDRFFFDFLRGCFDGDGSIYSYWDPRWRSSYMYYINFASASPLFLLWLQECVERFTEVHGTIAPSSHETQQLRFAKKGTQVLFKKMFHTEGISCLTRKFVKLQKILTMDRLHKDDAQVLKLVNRSA